MGFGDLVWTEISNFKKKNYDPFHVENNFEMHSATLDPEIGPMPI